MSYSALTDVITGVASTRETSLKLVIGCTKISVSSFGTSGIYSIVLKMVIGCAKISVSSSATYSVVLNMVIG